MFNLFANFDLSSNLNILVIFVFSAIFLLSAFFLSYGRIVNNIISLYVTLAIIEGVPLIRGLIEQVDERDPLYNIKMILLGILIIGIFALVSRRIFQHTVYGQAHINWWFNWWKVLILEFAQAGLFVSIMLRYFDSILASYVSWSIRKIFIGEIAKMIWFLLPIVILIAINKISDKEEGGHV